MCRRRRQPLASAKKSSSASLAPGSAPPLMVAIAVVIAVAALASGRWFYPPSAQPPPSVAENVAGTADSADSANSADSADSADTVRHRQLLFQLAARGQRGALLRAMPRHDAPKSPLRNVFVDHRHQQTILHVVVQAQFAAINNGADPRIVATYDEMLDVLLKHPHVNARLYCPLVDAVHYRLVVARTMLIAHLQKTGGLKACLTEIDTNGEHVLHVASKSKASGFARYFLAARRRASPHGDSNDRSVNVSARQFHPARFGQETIGELSFAVLNAASTIGAADLVALVRAGADVGLGMNWLTHRSSGPLESPLLAGCRGGREEVVRVLLRELMRHATPTAALLQAEGHWNMTCAHLAAARGHMSVLDVLFDLKGAARMMSAKDGFGRTPADVACAAGRVEVARRMILGRLSNVQRCVEKVSEPGLHRSAEDVAVFSCAVSKPPGTLLSSCVDSVRVKRNRRCKIPTEGSKGARHEWRTSTAAVPNAASSPPCALAHAAMVPRVHLSDGLEFSKNFYSLRRPVVLTGLEGGPNQWPAKRHWQREAFLSKHGDHAVSASVIPYASLYGEEARRVKLRSFVASWDEEEGADKDGDGGDDGGGNNGGNGQTVEFVFEGSNLFHGLGLASDVRVPDILSVAAMMAEQRTYLRQFSLGNFGSGAQPHFHGDAWNGLVFGTKQWVFQSNPSGNFTAGVDARSAMVRLHKKEDPTWALHVGSSLAVALQREGDVVFVPEMFSHMTLNFGESLCVAFESY